VSSTRLVIAKGKDTLKVLVRDTSSNDLLQVIFKQAQVILYEKLDRE